MKIEISIANIVKKIKEKQMRDGQVMFWYDHPHTFEGFAAWI